MEILRYEKIMLSDLTAAYNNITRGVPHCYPVNDEEFASAMVALTKEGYSYERLHSEAAFVAREGSTILGFVHVAIELSEKLDAVDVGVIRFLWYERGHRVAGQALLDAAEEYFRQRNLNRVMAFPQSYRYQFYHFANAFLSDHLDGVQALLAFNGYERRGGEVFLDWPNYNKIVVTPSEVSADISVEWNEGRGTRDGSIVRAHKDGEEIGACISLSGGEYSQVAEVQDWLFVISLWITEPFQGKRLGIHLLQRSLQEMRDAGYRHASISTSLTNYRAFLFYSNCGFHVVDWTYGFSRELKDEK
ncbi:GNAT family N-acetyltransferase [Candidatus Poribacteria bacterium]|nr:GNAT family N-acetyltransferase [Candidatus Poribacteria bacterium]